MEMEDTQQYHVVVNDEEQFSIWPIDRDLPPNWTATGFSGNKGACMEHIKEIWTDMRPLSLRKQMEENQP